MEATTALPFVVRMDACSPDDVIDAAVLEAFSSRAFPVARTITLRRVRASATLLPPTASAFLEATEDGETRRLAAGNGWMLRSVRYANGSARLTAIATSVAVAKSILAAATRDAVVDAPPSTACFSFWHHGKYGAKRDERALPIERWADIRDNYAAANATELDALMSIDPAMLEGRLALLHGPPGTGKTTLIRCLADAWRDWCTPEYVLDADSLLADPSYLMKVLLKGDDDDEDGDRAKRWRLLVLEDCGEFLRTDAKQETGQGLSRLLNLTDGLIGQGLNLLVLISTNDELARLHPAVTRAGRCFAQVRVGPLPYTEAVRWLGRREGVGPDGATLAELYALRRDPSACAAEAAPAGMYL
jgi:hypothetical protein